MALAIVAYFFLRSECLEPNIKYYINCLWSKLFNSLRAPLLCVDRGLLNGIPTKQCQVVDPAVYLGTDDLD